MAITTGAADTGVLSLNVGSRPRAGNAGDGDDFANTLDTQMQEPRAQSRRADPRAKHESPKQPAETKGKTDEQPVSREARAAGDRGTARKEGAEKAAGKEAAEPDQNLVALLLQSRLPDAETKGASEGKVGGTTEEGGKDLPLSENDDAAAALLAATTAGDAAKGTAVAAAAPGGRTIDPRLKAAAVSVTAETLPVDVPDAGEGGDASALLAGRAADAVREQKTESTPSSATPSDPTAQNAAPKGEKTDTFAAALAALRDATPRSTSEATTTAVTAPAAAVANGPQNVTGNASPPQLPTVNVPVGQHGWDQVVGERVLWMTRHNLQEAKIELNPRDLGPIEVRVSVQDDQARVAFTTHSPAARDALEAAMPRLRDMLADSGLNLAQSDVSHRSPQQQAEGGWGNGGQQASGNLLGGGTEEQPSATVETPLPSLGAVDYYA